MRTIGDDLLFGEEFERVGQRLEPARPDPVLELGDKLPIDPLVKQTRCQQEEASGEEEKARQAAYAAHR
jgi:hypothetical protein